MRILLELPGAASGDARVEDWAAAAEAAGLHGLALGPDAGIGAIAAPPVLLATRDVRVVVPVVLGEENPVTLAEELVVLDALGAGRLAALVETEGLAPDAAAEDLALLRRALSGRPIRHRGARWTVPAGLAEGVSESVVVTPGLTQIELPIWLAPGTAGGLAEATGLPVVAADPGDALRAEGVQPARAALTGELDTDRELVLRWFAAGATHLVAALPAGSAPRSLSDYVARYLLPEVAMTDFPRLMAETAAPPPWPGRLAPVE